MLNPYVNIDWNTTKRIISVTHQHLAHRMTGFTPQNAFDEIYGTGVRHFAVSRYRPSIPTYPFDYEHGTFVYVANPFTSTDDINTLKEEYAFTVNIPSDVIGSPNAEHVYPYIYVENKEKKWHNIHINALGSLYESGTIPNPDTGYKTDVGLKIPYTDAIDNMLDNLQYEDGGGIIINHMTWTHNNRNGVNFDIGRFVQDCLDYDSRVLGTDIIESGSQERMSANEERIDGILSTGRRCWIFCQGDWGRVHGRNVLLLPSNFDALSKAEQEHECLKAYRNGAFYGRWGNSNMDVTSISFINGFYSITAANADKVRIIVDGVATEYNGDTANQTIPNNAKYVRAEAYKELTGEDSDGELYNDVLFTNPIMVNPVTYPYDPAYDHIEPPSPEPEYDPKPTKYNLLFWG